MAQLEDLLNDLANLDAQHDLDGMRRLRERIVSEHPDTEAAVEALYKIGLDLLFRERNLNEAVAKFEEAGKRKHPFWSSAARTSLGLCYHHQGRTQKALFELRKVAYPEQPTPHSVTALTFIENILESQNAADEVKRTRKDRIAQLEKLTEQSKVNNRGSERGYYLYQLAVAWKDAGDDAKARTFLEEAKALGPEVLGADLFRAVVSSL
jgi:tetratricopeptide (TPR) repeat protein